jgi:hemerythrin-like metal-binding protein
MREVSYVSFTPSLKIGNRQIDQLHATWFQLADSMLQLAGMDVDERVLRFKAAHFLKFSAAMFRLEEDILRRVGYDRLMRHRLQHMELVTELRNLLLATDDIDELRYRLRESLIVWVVEHVAEADRDYAEVFG